MNDSEEITPEQAAWRRQLLAEVRAQKEAEDAAWIARLRAAGHCYDPTNNPR